MTRVACPSVDCHDGLDLTLSDTCQTCGGKGMVNAPPPQPAREALNALVGPEAAAVLVANAAVMLDVLGELGALAPTKWGICPTHATDAWGHAGPTVWLPREVPAGFTGTRLYKVTQ